MLTQNAFSVNFVNAVKIYLFLLNSMATVVDFNDKYQ